MAPHPYSTTPPIISISTAYQRLSGNTDWSIPVDAGANIVNFDAYEYGETIALYPEHMKRLIVERRDALAW
ncbi:MAG: hypothetical protein ACYTFA_18880, partial [Planctomycetota bacterium]